MTNEKTSGHAAALLNQLLDVLLWADRAPTSPVKKFHQAKERRELRRAAARLRAGQAEPRHTDLTREELADIYERTARRDEIVERAYIDFKRIDREFGRVLEEKDPEERKKLDAFLDELERAARKDGLESRAGRRFEHLRVLGWFSGQHKGKKRRQKGKTPRHLPLVLFPPVDAPFDTSDAEIPLPYASVPGPPRVFVRTRADGSEVIGISDRAYESVSEIYDLPDANRLVVSEKRTGYVVDIRSRTLVKEIEAKVLEVIFDEELTLLFIHRGDGRLEGFGKTGPLWTTDPICTAEFRNPGLTDAMFFGVAQCSCGGWAGFVVDVATGEVSYP